MPTKHTTNSLAIAGAAMTSFIAAFIASPSANAQTQTQALGAAQAVAADAKAATSATGMSAAEELATLQAQIPILEAKARIAKLKAEIDNGGSNATPGPGGAALPAMPSWGTSSARAASPPAPAADSASARSGMQAISISGFDGRFQAALTIDGRNVTVRPGDTLDGGWKVSNITESSVTLVRGKQVVVLRV